MLSRIADAMFWTGRYIERADQTARILDVNLQAITEDAASPVEDRLRSLYRIFGITDVPAEQLSAQGVLDTLATDRVNPSSIAGSLQTARENARGAREVLSTDVWESLNTARLELPRTVHPSRMHGFFRWAKDRCAVTTGLIDASMTRDEAWLFLRIGQLLERVDMAARILQAHDLDGAVDGSTALVLRTCSAHEAYIRTYRGQVRSADAIAFLLLDSIFPRSVAHCLLELEEALDRLSKLHGHAFDRFGTEDPAQRSVGRALASLRYRSLEDLVEDFDQEMEHLQSVTQWVSRAIGAQYFSPSA